MENMELNMFRNPHSAIRHLQSALRNPKSAFTLVELMTVIAIIAILAGLILGVSGYATGKADRSRAIAEMEKIKGGLEEYRLQYGEYPTNGPGAMTGASFISLRNQLTNTMQNTVTDLNFVDPWGNGYYYSRPSKFVYTLSSWGPDLTDTNDNITAGLVGM
jgi:type II secretion system protein G